MFEDRLNANHLIDDLIGELELLKEDWEHLDGKKLRVRIEKKIKSLRNCIQKVGRTKNPSSNLEPLAVFREANLGSFSQCHDVCGISSISQQGEGNVSGDTRIDAIAIVEVLAKDSSVQLDTSNPHFLLLNVATAMQHADTLPQARYVAGLDEWGRVLLQAQGNSHRQYGSLIPHTSDGQQPHAGE